MRPWWRRAAGAVCGLAVLGAGIWLARRGAHSTEIAPVAAETRQPSAPAVEVVRPHAGGILRSIQQPASIHAFETVDLYAMVSGDLKTQSVDIGSRIKKGEVLAEINVPRDAKAVEEAASLVEQARARVGQAEAVIKVAEAQRDAAEATANQAASDVDRLKAERVLAEKQFARVSELAARRAVDQKLVDEQQSTLDAARAAERTAGIAVQTARARALAAAAEVEKAKVDADAARASLGVAEASRDRLKVNLEYARIVAPFEGVVTHRTFHPGALIHSAMGGGSQPLLTVKRTDKMRVVVLVPDRDVVLTTVGDEAVVAVDALDGRSFEGTLARIAKAEDAERLMRVEIDLPNPDSLLYDGMYGKATISLGRHNSLCVPSACVVEHSGRSRGVVYVARDGEAHKTVVKLGGDNGTLAEILSGIKPDDAVVLRSSTPLEDGILVDTVR
jgi:RND family efflux transporter MFP subunit